MENANSNDEISVSYLNMAAWIHRIAEPAVRSAIRALLNATCAAHFPYTDDTKPGLHILRSLGWLQRAGLEEPKACTFVADVQAPLEDAARNALMGSFQMFWGKAGSEVAPEDWAEYQRLCRPESPDLILNPPDYYAFITYSLFSCKVPT